MRGFASGVYITNNGGFEWTEITRKTGESFLLPGDQPAEYTGGGIDRVDLKVGVCVPWSFRVLCTP